MVKVRVKQDMFEFEIIDLKELLKKMGKIRRIHHALAFNQASTQIITFLFLSVLPVPV